MSSPTERRISAIAHIETDYGTKFGVPRQAGLVAGTLGRIVMEPPYRVADAFRGLEGFSHIWLLWDFSEAHTEGPWRPTVRPPRLGGNLRMGVFATRSPFRPCGIGLSAVRLVRLEPLTPDGPVLWVEGADLMDGTPIFDIKPYLPFTDAHPEATGGYTDQTHIQPPLRVDIPPALAQRFAGVDATAGSGASRPAGLGIRDEHGTRRQADPGITDEGEARHRTRHDIINEHGARHLAGPDIIDESGAKRLQVLIDVLAADPRPRYHDDPARTYGMTFAGREVRFRVADGTLTVIDIQ